MENNTPNNGFCQTGGLGSTLVLVRISSCWWGAFHFWGMSLRDPPFGSKQSRSDMGLRRSVQPKPCWTPLAMTVCPQCETHPCWCDHPNVRRPYPSFRRSLPVWGNQRRIRGRSHAQSPVGQSRVMTVRRTPASSPDVRRGVRPWRGLCVRCDGLFGIMTRLLRPHSAARARPVRVAWSRCRSSSPCGWSGGVRSVALHSSSGTPEMQKACLSA
jgi:hypothetical protein